MEILDDKRWKQRVRDWWPALGWAALISFFSSGYFGGEYTSRFILPFLQWLLPDATLETLWQLHWLVRKAAHFVEYCLLSLFVLRGLRGGTAGWRWRWAVWAVLISAGYAGVDEIHQHFVPGRGAAVEDVLLDSAGAVVGQLLALLWIRTGEDGR